MHVHVALEISRLCESLATDVAAVRLFAGMRAQMFLERRGVDKCLHTHRALVGLLLRVRLEMDHGVGAIAEPFDCRKEM